MPKTLSTQHYPQLSPHERFRLSIEALGRKDDAELDRLDDSCPRFSYYCEDQAFRGRMRLVFSLAAVACLNMHHGLAQIRMAQRFQECAKTFAFPVTRLAQIMFILGRKYGAQEPVIEPLTPASLNAELERDPELRKQLEEIEEVSITATKEIADTLVYSMGELHARVLLAQWEGWNRFCRETLEMEPTALLKALALPWEDVGAEVRETFPEAEADEAKVAEWAGNWRRVWGKQVKA